MNVLFVISDQHHAGLMACAGHAQAITPNMDALARAGLRFDAAYCQNPICTPSRVSILSGQYCHNTGYYGLSGPTPRALPSMMGHFRQHGYRTAGFGKLHLPNNPRNWLADDLDRFADSYENLDGEHGRSEFLASLENLGLREWEDSWHNEWNYGKGTIAHDAMPSRLPYEHTQEVWSAREAMKFMDESAEANEPFCIQVAFQKPHHPLLPQQKFWDMYDPDLDLPETYDLEPAGRPPHFRQMWDATHQKTWEYGEPGESNRDGARRAWRGTLACVTQIDDVLGMLLRGLEERGIADRTIVVYGSDHGCYHTIHGIHEKAPGICSDAVCRVPMIWRVPGLTPSGGTSDQFVENVDIASTLAALCGLPAMDSVDGEDITGLLRGGDEPVREVAVTEHPWSKSLRWKQWRFVHYQPEMFDGEDVGELYDIENDPDETTNLYHRDDHREVVERCRRRLLEWIIRTTRVTTCHPGPKSEKRHDYRLAGDGKETNDTGPAERVRRGILGYI